MSDSVTLVLDGTISLGDLATAFGRFHGLVAELSRSVVPGARIDWVVESLQGASAIATARGLGVPEEVDSVVRAYEQVGKSLEREQPIPFSAKVREEAEGLARLVDDRIQSIRLETDRVDAIVRARPVRVREAVPETAQETYGAVEGLVETLLHRGGLRFTLYDLLFDKAVSCYLKPGYEDIMRNAWGRRAMVFGRVRRDVESGRPLSVRQVTAVELREEGHPDDWRQARGAAPATTEIPPEASIRAVRESDA